MSDGPFAPVGPVVLDAGALARLRELDPDGSHAVVARVLGTFENSLRRLLAQVQADAAVGNVDGVARAAHTLKSSSSSVGALELAAACVDIEARLRGGGGATLERDVGHLLAHGQAALTAVAAMLRP